jgi:hypothetical protein
MHSVGKFYELLNKLSNRLYEHGEHATIVLFGGGALSMRYGAREATKDLDVVFQDANRMLVREIAQEIGDEYLIESDWINDEGVGSVTREIIADSTTYLELPGLTVLAPSREALLAMKVCSMRTDSKYPDLNDIRFLIKELKIHSTDEVLDLTEKYRPDYASLLTPKHQYWVDVLISEVEAEQLQSDNSTPDID